MIPHIPHPRGESRLPTVLSTEEVRRFLAAIGNMKHRAALMTAYAAGLRASEVVAFRTSDIDSKRMLIHVRQAKGRKDRTVMLSTQLLELLREYVRAVGPGEWLFPGQVPARPLAVRSLQKACENAHRACGLQKRVSVHTLRHSFFLPVRVLSRVFRGKWLALARSAYESGRLHFHGKLAHLNDDPAAFRRLLTQSRRHDWSVYARPPFGGPEQALKYLARYTHRIAISNHRLLAVDPQAVTFSWKDYAHANQQRTMALETGEFARRFLLHVLPAHFVRIRSFGFLANSRRAEALEQCRTLLAAQPQSEAACLSTMLRAARAARLEERARHSGAA